MMDRIKEIVDMSAWIPFVLTTGVAKPHLSPARLIEAVIIAALAGAMSVWATTIVIKNDIKHIKETQDNSVQLYRDTQRDIRDLEKLLYTHKHGDEK